MAALNGIREARRVVIKIGSALLVDGGGGGGGGGLRLDWLAALAEDIARLRGEGREVVVVSSGSIALGRRALGMPSGLLSLEQSQAAAAVGQIRLARAYENALRPHGIAAAQLLVTLEDSENRRRYLNTRRTLGALLQMGVVPIVNENDTVATDEIRFGDNDRLGAQVAVMAGADLLVVLSDVDGLYSASPKSDPAARHMARIAALTPEIMAMAGETENETARGGMKTKLLAARTATTAGCAMVICAGTGLHPIGALENGARHSWFVPRGDPKTARKQWILAMKPRGTVFVDAGAAAALMRGTSLLPAGVTAIEGRFGRGDPVAIAEASGATLGKGLAGYESDEARAIIGRHSRDIAGILGYPGRAALIHRDDMVI